MSSGSGTVGFYFPDWRMFRYHWERASIGWRKVGNYRACITDRRLECTEAGDRVPRTLPSNQLQRGVLSWTQLAPQWGNTFRKGLQLPSLTPCTRWKEQVISSPALGTNNSEESQTTMDIRCLVRWNLDTSCEVESSRNLSLWRMRSR